MRLLLAVLAFLVLPLHTATAQTDAMPGWALGDEIIEARLIADRSVAAPGEEFYLGLNQVMPEGWHTYWKNPGDFGQPLELTWTLPEGVSIGDVIWPAPVELPIADGEIMDYGYYDEVTLPMPIRLAEDFAGDRLDLVVDAYWQVCDEVCVPEERQLSFSLPVDTEAQRDETSHWMIQASLEAVPARDDSVVAVLDRVRDRLVLQLDAPLLADADSWRDLTFMPGESGLIEHAPEQVLQREEGGRLYLIMEPSWKLEGDITSPRLGLLSFERQQGGGIWGRESVEIEAQPGDISIALPSPTSAPVQTVSLTGLLTLIVLALGGGLILNLMPCVFPVLSIKVLKFVEVAQHDPNKVRRHGLYFLSGVVLSFVALAGLLVVLRELGLPVGWGFQLQLPIVVAVLALLFFAIGLNLLGVFEVGTSIMGIGSDLADAPGARGAFFTGVLAVVVAAPCVGPLAAGALGLALTQPAFIVLSVAAAMGVGLALPFVVLTFAPALLRLLPRPGKWMETFKQALAFPMFAALLWLVWVLSIQAGPQGVLFLGLAMLALTFAIWASKQGGVAWSGIALASALGLVLTTVWIARLPTGDAAAAAGPGEVAWSDAAVEEAQMAGRAVFVDVTAAWCVTCQVNKMRVLNDGGIQTAFVDMDATLMRADWTNRDDRITDLIYRHGGAGVPLYLVYPAGGGEPQVLPTVLTRQIVLDALETASG